MAGLGMRLSRKGKTKEIGEKPNTRTTRTKKTEKGKRRKVMNIEKKKDLITGANSGSGRELVHEALRRGVKKVYAGTRSTLGYGDPRVTPLTLDVTSVSQIQRATGEVDTLDVLINNAGVAIYDDLSNLDIVE